MQFSWGFDIKYSDITLYIWRVRQFGAEYIVGGNPARQSLASSRYRVLGAHRANRVLKRRTESKEAAMRKREAIEPRYRID